MISELICPLGITGALKKMQIPKLRDSDIVGLKFGKFLSLPSYFDTLVNWKAFDIQRKESLIVVI